MICPKCGNQNMEGSTICVKCGTNLKDLNQNNITNNGFVDSNIQNNFESTNNFENTGVQEPVNSTNDFINPGSQPVQQEIPPFVNPSVQEPVNNYTEPVQEPVNFINPGEQTPTPSYEQPMNNYSAPVQEQPVYNNYSNVNNNNYSNETKKSNKIVPIIVVIVLLALGFGAYKLFFSGKGGSNSDSLEFTSILSVRDSEGHYIYIDLNGENIFGDRSFESATSFHDGYALVREDYKRKIINEKGEVIIEEGDSSINNSYVSEYKVWIVDGKLYSSDLKKLTSDDIEVEYYEGIFKWKSKDKSKMGLLNEKGKIVYTYTLTSEDYDYLAISTKGVDRDIYKYNYCAINIWNKDLSKHDEYKYTLINCDTGKEIYPLSKDRVIYEDKNNVFHVKEKDNSYLIVVNNDKIVFKGDYDDTSIYDRSEYLEIYDRTNRTYKYYDIKNDKMLDKKPETPKVDVDDLKDLSKFEITYNVREYSEDGKYGLKKNDKVIVNAEYKSFYGFSSPIYDYLKSKGKEYFFAEKDGKMYMLDMKGKKIKEFNTSYMETHSESPFVDYIDSELKKRVVYNVLNGKSTTIDYNYSYLYEYENYFVTKEVEGGKWIYKYYNPDCKLIYTEEI